MIQVHREGFRTRFYFWLWNFLKRVEGSLMRIGLKSAKRDKVTEFQDVKEWQRLSFNRKDNLSAQKEEG